MTAFQKDDRVEWDRPDGGTDAGTVLRVVRGSTQTFLRIRRADGRQITLPADEVRSAAERTTQC